MQINKALLALALGFALAHAKEQEAQKPEADEPNDEPPTGPQPHQQGPEQ